MFYSYVLQNEKGTLYKGSTSDLRKRLDYHHTGKSVYTRGKGPWKLVYYECFRTRKEAELREKYYKTGKGREFIKKLLKSNNSRIEVEPFDRSSRDGAIGSSQGS